MIYLSFTLDISLGFGSGLLLPPSLHVLLTIQSRRDSSTRPGQDCRNYFPSQIQRDTFSLQSAGVPLSFLQELTDPRCSWTSCQTHYTKESSYFLKGLLLSAPQTS